MPRECPSCHQTTLHEVSGLELVRESTGSIVMNMGQTFECSNPHCMQRRWVQQRQDDPQSLLPLD